jgi:hypothetical protein
MYRSQVIGSGELSFETSKVDRYTVAMFNCRDTPSNVNAYVWAEAKNIQPTGDGFSQLDISDVMYTRVLGGEILIYCLLSAGLIGQMLVEK